MNHEEISREEMEDLVESDNLIGHACIYLFNHQMHIDYHCDDNELDITELATSFGELVTAIIIRSFSENASCQH